MIKNGRPYTCENGYRDDKLLVNGEYDFNTHDKLSRVGDWIKENIRPGSEENTDHTSYGLKHFLEDATGVYLTNNEFKDAMLLAGYEPINSIAVNWTWRISYLPDEIYNPNPFCQWVLRNVTGSGPDGPETDFADDMECDRSFPVFAEHDIIRGYLEMNGACRSAINAFERLWEQYSKEKDTRY